MTWIWVAVGGALLLGIYVGVMITGILVAASMIPPGPGVDDDEMDRAGVDNWDRGGRRGDDGPDGHPRGVSA